MERHHKERGNIWFIRQKLPNFRPKQDKAALFGLQTVTDTDSNCSSLIIISH